MGAYCPQCNGPITGKVLRYDGANCCESCYQRLTGETGEHPLAWFAPSVSEPSYPTRTQIRALATEMQRQIRAAAMAEKNVHQLSLDQSLLIRQFANRLGAEQGTLFLHAYSEELEALTKHTLDEVKRIQTQAVVNQTRSSQNGTAVAMFFILLIFMLPVLLKSC